VPSFYSASVGDAPVRICAFLTSEGFEVYVAETTNKRDRLVWEVILAGLVPSLMVAVVAVALVWLGVSHGLAPLRKLRNELQQRSPNDLRPVDESHAPSEVRPAIIALNRLLQRIHETSQSQRRFLADAAHQLRTPLAGLQMQLELELRESNSTSLRATLIKMRDAVLRTGNVTNRLLALARAEQVTSTDRRDLAVCDLHALAERVGARGSRRRFRETSIWASSSRPRASSATKRCLRNVRQPDRQRAALHARRRLGDTAVRHRRRRCVFRRRRYRHPAYRTRSAKVFRRLPCGGRRGRRRRTASQSSRRVPICTALR
jgi:signal transduction histidine kinase